MVHLIQTKSKRTDLKLKQYRLTFKGIAYRSFGIWFSMIAYIAFLIFLLTGNDIDILGGIIMLNLVSLLIIFPGLILQLNYIFKTKGMVVEIGKDTIRMKKGKSYVVIEIEDIKEVLQINSWRWSRLPWWNHYYYKITDSNNSQVDLNLYCFKDGEIWINSSGLRKIQDEKLRRIEVFLPLIRKTHHNSK